MRLGITSRRRGFNAFWVFSVLLVFSVIFFAASRMHSALVASAHAYANNIATTAISKSVREVFKSSETELSRVNNEERAMMLDTDTSKINLINSDLAELLQEDVLKADYTTVKIPLGAVTGLSVFSGMGPKIPIRIHPISIVNTDFKETFDSCGINQVRHSITLAVDVSMAYSGYIFSTVENVSVNVPITDTVIVGDVPQYYGTNVGIEAENGAG